MTEPVPSQKAVHSNSRPRKHTLLIILYRVLFPQWLCQRRNFQCYTNLSFKRNHICSGKMKIYYTLLPGHLTSGLNFYSGINNHFKNFQIGPSDQANELIKEKKIFTVIMLIDEYFYID